MSNFFGIQKGGRQFRPIKYGDDLERHGDQLIRKDVSPADAGVRSRADQELGITARGGRPSDAGNFEWASQIVRIYRQTIAPWIGQALRPAQRRAIRDAIIDGMAGQGDSNTQAEIRLIASRMAGLTGESDEFAAAAGATLVKSWPDDGLSVFVPFLRKDEGKREVHGIIAQEEPDKSGEIFDYQSSKPHFQQWVNDAIERTASAGLPISYGNVRAQHSNIAAGKLTDVAFDDDRKCIPVVAKIVDDDTWRKVQAGVYTGFSIGGKYLRKWGDGPHTRYTAKPAEVSLVDSPCMPSATFTAIKSAGKYSELDAKLDESMRSVREKLAVLKTQIEELVAKRSGAAPATTTRFRANAPDNTSLLRDALNNPVTKAPTRDTDTGRRFVPRCGSDPELVAADAVTAVTKGSDVASELGKALASGFNPYSGK